MINAALSQLLKAVPESRLLGDDTSFVGAGIDTRTLQQGSLYIAIKGERFDGHDFVRRLVHKSTLSTNSA